MVRYRFGRDDLLRTRFAISPLFEATASVAALADPGRASINLPWVRGARERLGDADVSLLRALVPQAGYTPDFISPPPPSPLPDVEAEIARVARTPADQVRREVGWRYEGAVAPPPVVRDLLDDPERGLRRLASELTTYWELAMAPVWERIRAVLEDDIAHRARLLTAGGPIEVFADLHPQVRWVGDELLIDRPIDVTVELAGRGVQLVPSVFVWPSAGALFDPPWQPGLIYPPRGIGLLWEPAPPPDDGALAALLGARRAEILGALDHEASTTTLARRLGGGAPGVSEHLGVLRRAGLLRARRDGREVLYARTAAGDALLRAPGAQPSGKDRAAADANPRMPGLHHVALQPPPGDRVEGARAPDEPSDDWVRALGGSGPSHDAAVARLHELLLRAAHFELARRAASLQHVARAERADLATQAADDAVVAILAKLHTFRGDSRFTTWAYKFVLLEAAVKARRRAWQGREVPLDEEAWPQLADRGPTAQRVLEEAELLDAIRDGVRTALTPHQREVFVALALNAVPIDVLAERLGTTRGALYKTLHDARRRLRAALAQAGLTIGDDREVTT
jgi:RNA polymerase sigma factor (sigma-70 family)